MKQVVLIAALVSATSAHKLTHLPDPIEPINPVDTFQYNHKKHEINDLVKNTIAEARKTNPDEDMGTKIDEAERSVREA